MKRIMLTILMALLLFGFGSVADAAALVIKNVTKCVYVDYIICEMREGEAPLPVAGAMSKPGDRQEYDLPDGTYCVYAVAYVDGKWIQEGVRCGVIPDPTLPLNAKPTLIFDAEKGVCNEVEA